MKEHTIKDKKTSRELGSQIAYAAPSMAMALLFSPIGILQGIYSKYFGISLTTIAFVLLISRLFDAVTDPVVGYLSDRYHFKKGSRKPFILIGGLLFIASGYCLYSPVIFRQVNNAVVVSNIYFLVFFLFTYLAWTLIEIPHLAWGAEITDDSRSKNRIYSLRSAATFLGSLLFFSVPLLPFFPSNEFTPETLKWIAIVAGLLMLLALFVCLKFTPNGSGVYLNNEKSQSIWALRKEIVENKPFLLFIGAFFLYGAGCSGMWFTMKFIYIDAYLKLGNYFALMGLIGVICGTSVLGFWCWLANKWGKKNSWIVGLSVYMAGIMIVGLLTPEQSDIAGLTVAMLCTFSGSSAITAISPSILADIVDYNTRKFGTDRTATFFSLYTTALKTSLAVGGAMALLVADWCGFDPEASVNTESAIFGLKLAACWLPVLLMLLATLLMRLVSITTRQDGIVLESLDTQIKPESVM